MLGAPQVDTNSYGCGYSRKICILEIRIEAEGGQLVSTVQSIYCQLQQLNNLSMYLRYH